MDKGTRWLNKYKKVVDFIQTNKRNLSQNRIDVHDMLNWMKANRKRMNSGNLKAERVEMFK